MRKGTYAIKSAGGDIERKEGKLREMEGMAKGEGRGKRKGESTEITKWRIANGIL